MVPPISNEINLAWRALSGGDDGDGWRSIAVSSIGPCKLRAARCFPNNEEALLLRFESLTLPKPNLLPQGNGFKVERTFLEVDDSKDMWLALIRQSHASFDLFSRMVSDIVSTLSASSSNDELHLFKLFLGRIRAWQDFMKKGHEGLGPEAELGLVGEIECLDMLLNAGLPATLALDGWLGPQDGLQDFELGTGAIEVKSTLAIQGFQATIMSLEQLDHTVLQPLFVCGCQFKIDSKGESLPSRITSMRKRLSIDTSATALFENNLLYVGYMDIHATHYTRKFQPTTVRFWLVDNNFPRLILANVPKGVRSACYSIDLETVQSRQVSASEAIEMLGMY